MARLNVESEVATIECDPFEFERFQLVEHLFGDAEVEGGVVAGRSVDADRHQDVQLPVHVQGSNSQREMLKM